MIDSNHNYKDFAPENTNANSKLLDTYQKIISELMLQAKTNSECTVREFLERLELE